VVSKIQGIQTMYENEDDGLGSVPPGGFLYVKSLHSP
jgi:hypothetical protein